jgi:hypothetical protein
MGRHRFGEGEYRYFKAPYPEPVERLKQALYPRLLPIARDRWPQYRGKPTASLVDLAAPMDYATRTYGYIVWSSWF